jgi:hypothetical protein
MCGRSWMFLTCSALVSACALGPSNGAIDAVVTFGPRSEARCMKLNITSATGMALLSEPFRRKERPQLSIGIGPTSTLNGDLTIVAQGYPTEDCSGEPTEKSLPGEGSLRKRGVITKIELALNGPPPRDGGLDDAGTPDAGSTDAGPTDGGVDGGNCAAHETNCSDGLEDDCDNLRDCADPDCLGIACGNNGTCSASGCTGQQSESLCGDNVDNDGDGKIDCADPDCASKPCSDGNACTTGEVCGAGGCAGGVASVTCTNSAANCRASVGQCIPADGGCSFALLDAGSACSDALACTRNDTCSAAGACSGIAYTCGPATACAAAGMCLGDGGCNYAPSPVGTSCDDNGACTHSDQCNGSGVCAGKSYACATAPACFQSGVCQGDAGCSFAASPAGTACPGGICAGDGGCVSSAFSYPPSNFAPASIPAASIAPSTVFTNCAAAFNSTTNTFGGWCGQTQPTPIVITQVGGVAATVLAMNGLSISANATLTLSGDRPVILVVFGDATVDGVIDARSIDLSRKGPGGSWSGCGTMAGANATFASLGGGGGGAFGSPGSNGAGAGFGAGGVDGGVVTLIPLHGGCKGGDGSAGVLIAQGGVGGGGVQVSVSGTLTVGGTLSAGGGGGRPGLVGAADNSGGGGASGGAILLEGLDLDIGATAKLTANGGGGAGGHQNGQPDGDPGVNGSLDTTTPASGGQGGGSKAGDGANGAAGATGASAATAGMSAGGGGGGGGLGRIRLNGIKGCTIAAVGPVFSGVVSKPAPCP